MVRGILIITLFSFSATAAPKIKVRSEAIVEGLSQITLGDITDFHEIMAEDVLALSKIPLGSAPAVGKTKNFKAQSVSRVFRKKLSRNKYPQLKLIIPRQIQVKHLAYDMTADTIETRLKSHWLKFCKECRFEISALSVPLVPDHLEGQPWSLKQRTQLPRGSFSQQLVVTDNHGKPHIYWVSGQLKIFKKVPVILRAASLGERIQPTDIGQQDRDVTFATDSTPDQKEVIGRRLRRNLRANDILWTGTIERERAVTRGQLVQIWAGNKSFRISMKGISQQDAFVGDSARIRNPRSQKIMVGRVIAPGEVRVE